MGYLVTGINGGQGSEFEQEAALDAFGQGERLTAGQIGSLSIDTEWEAAKDGFEHVYRWFVDWQERPDAYQVAKEKWWQRRIRVEVGVSVSTLEGYLRHGTFRT